MLPAPSVQTVANGQQMQSQHKVQSVQWWTQGYSFDTSMLVLQLGAYDVVLGMDWLKCHSPMTFDWNEKTIQFLHKDQPVTLQGIRAPSQVSLEAMSVEQLDKALAGNDVWALGIADLYEISSDTTAPQPATLTQLLEDFQDVFEQPTGLPPHRAYDHALSLEPGHSPPNSRPYHYSPQQKDEIECQVAEMITAGIVQPSMSPYASPVLVVKKKDGGWRICVDKPQTEQCDNQKQVSSSHCR